MNNSDDLLFATIDSLPILDKVHAASEILALPEYYSFWDDYRYTQMFSLMTRQGVASREGVSNAQSGDFLWTDIAPRVIVDWCEDHLFPWLGMRSRIMCLVTQPGVANYEHIDCAPHELNTRQHKVRIVLQGNTDTLYWMTEGGNVHAPAITGAFVMDGGWPHGMINIGSIPKVTLALGAPWTGKAEYNDITILQHRSSYRMPKNIDHLWHKKK